jgi:hypothetical protein
MSATTTAGVVAVRRGLHRGEERGERRVGELSAL